MFRRLAFVLMTTVAAVQPVAAQAPAAGSRVLVLPFENPARDPRSYWLTEGAAVLLTDELTARGVAAMRRDERQEAFERLQVPTVATLSRATVIRLGEIVGAGEVVIGSLALAGDTLAEAFLAGGNAVAARREVDRALVLAPGSAEARALLERLNGSQAPQPQ